MKIIMIPSILHYAFTYSFNKVLEQMFQQLGMSEHIS